MNVDREKLRTVGFEAIKDFLRKLHILKSLGDYESGKKFFDGYSVVDEQMLKVRELVIANKVPRRINLQPNVILDPVNGEPQYRGYEETFEGVI